MLVRNVFFYCVQFREHANLEVAGKISSPKFNRTNDIVKIVNYLGINVSAFLKESPFNTWSVEREDEADLQLRSYVFKDHGLELCCDNDGRITTIFAENGFDETFLDIAFTLERSQVLIHFGTPSRSGSSCINQKREIVPWDLFKFPSYALNIRYDADKRFIRRMTFMELDQVPEPISEKIILVFIPSLLSTLMNREDSKGAPLSEEEVLSIRDSCSVTAATVGQFQAVEEARGYKDLDAENAWSEWQKYKEDRDQDRMNSPANHGS